MRDFIYIIIIAFLIAFTFAGLAISIEQGRALKECRESYKVLKKTHSHYIAGYNVCTGQAAGLKNQLNICKEDLDACVEYLCDGKE